MRTPASPPKVSIGRTITGGYLLAEALSISLPGQDPVQAVVMVAACHRVCPYSTAIHGNVEVSSTITV